MSIKETAQQFETELNELKVTELCEKECQDTLFEIRTKIDEFLNMIRFKERTTPRDLDLNSHSGRFFKKERGR